MLGKRKRPPGLTESLDLVRLVAQYGGVLNRGFRLQQVVLLVNPPQIKGPNMANELPELKPCPFCGGRAVYHADHTTERCDSVYCESCDVHVSDFGFDMPTGYCAEFWNTRTAPKVNPLRRRPCKIGEVADSIFGEVIFSFDGEWVDEQLNQSVQVDMPWGECEVFSNLLDADEWSDEMIERRILSALE